MARSLARFGIGIVVGMGLALAPVAGAGEPAATPAPLSAADHPLSTEWLSAAPLLPGLGLADDSSSACRVQDPAGRVVSAGTAAKLARIRALLAAEAAQAPEGAGEVVVLGNRGYNYGSGAMVDPSLIEFEARRDR